MNEIKSAEDYITAEAKLEVLAQAIPGTPEAQELKAITQAIVAYLKTLNPMAGTPEQPAAPAAN